MDSAKAHGPGSFAAATCWRRAWPLPIAAGAAPGRDEQETTCTALRFNQKTNIGESRL